MLRAFFIGAILAFAAASCGGLCKQVCDGCCTEQGICVPLAQTARDQCGRGGQACMSGCPSCEQGACTTGPECWGGPPPSCECGTWSPGSPCAITCGFCPQDATCVDFRCVAADGGVDDAGTDGGGTGDAGLDDGG